MKIVAFLMLLFFLAFLAATSGYAAGNNSGSTGSNSGSEGTKKDKSGNSEPELSLSGGDDGGDDDGGNANGEDISYKYGHSGTGGGRQRHSVYNIGVYRLGK